MNLHLELFKNGETGKPNVLDLCHGAVLFYGGLVRKRTQTFFLSTSTSLLKNETQFDNTFSNLVGRYNFQNIYMGGGGTEGLGHKFVEK